MREALQTLTGLMVVAYLNWCSRKELREPKGARRG
jgi:hypothetical protein